MVSPVLVPRAVPPEELLALAGRADFPLEEDALSALGGYLSLLVQWNAKMNLVGARTWQEAFSSLVADCLHLADFMRDLPLPPEPQVWDPGAGAGLPGIPLRILWRAGTYSMIEAREKRALFLQNVLARWPLPGVKVFQGRLEAFMRDHPPADCVVSRAFMPWRDLLALVGERLAPRGLVVFMANDPPPGMVAGFDAASSQASPEALPDGWRLCASHVYLSGCAGLGRRTPRHFWALAKTV